MIYIVNSQPFIGMGHHWVVDSYVRKALKELNHSFMYINPSSQLAKSEDGLNGQAENIYWEIEESSNLRQIYEIIKAHSTKNNLAQATILFTWLPQFAIDDLAQLKFCALPELRIAAITLLSEQSINREKSEIRYYGQELFTKNSNFKILWTGENIPNYLSNNSFLRQLPDYHSNPRALEDRIGNNLSFFGQLSAFRGATEILLIALFNPTLKVKIKGYGFHSTRIFRPVRIKKLRYSSWRDNVFLAIMFSLVSIPVSFLRFLPNIDFSNVPFKSEEELGKAIADSGAIFYCPKFPHGSGITMKSLASGVPILWNGLPGHAQKILSEKSPFGEFKYYEIFIPNRISRKLFKVRNCRTSPAYDWSDFLDEIKECLRILNL
jgi:hypothetical protein